MKLCMNIYEDVKARYIVPLLITITIVMSSIHNPASAQIAEFEEFHTWTDVATIYFFDPNFRYDGDYGLRGVLTDPDWTLLYIRPSVRYSEWNWMQLHGGVGLFYNFIKDGYDLPEIRPWVGIRFIWPRIGGFSFSHYFRLEYRAFYFKSEQKWETSFRGRYQLQISNNNFSIGELKGFVALASIELFEDMNTFIDGTFGDRYRFNIGFGKRIFDDLRIDINYVFHKLNLGGGLLQADDHIIRTRFFYNFNWPQDFIQSEEE
jgi:hypothetical protein